MSLPLTRKFLSPAREAQIKGYFHRHGFKILILGRFAVGFRTAAYLTAGILKLPALKLFLTDLVAASLSTLLMFGLGFVFAHQIESSFDRVKHWLTAIVAVALATWLLYRYYKGRQRAGLPVGPPVLVADDVPLPPDDLHPHHDASVAVAVPAPALVPGDSPAEGDPRAVGARCSAAGERPARPGTTSRPGRSASGSMRGGTRPLESHPALRLSGERSRRKSRC